MTLLSESEQHQVGAAITRIERETDAEVVTVLARQADDYRYIPLLWAGLLALIVPGSIGVIASLLGAALWTSAGVLLLVQWLAFVVLAVVFRIPAITTRLIPRAVRYWRASNLARRQFLERNLHATEEGTGVLIFVSEAERYVEILVDRGISSRLSDDHWQEIVTTFTARVKAGETLPGFLDCIDQCGELLKLHVPATHERNELPDRLFVIDG